MLFLSTLILFLAPASYADTSSNWGAWQEVRQLYDAGKYDEALQALNSVPAHGANYYYNLGNIYFRMNKLGAAEAYLQKAHMLDPSDADIAHNLNLCQATLERTLGKERMTAAFTWSESLDGELPLMALGAILSLATLVASAWGLRKILPEISRSTSPLSSALSIPSTWIALAFAVGSLGTYAIHKMGSVNPVAVVAETQMVRSGPGDQYLELSEVASGMQLRYLGMIAQDTAGVTWLQVRYSHDGGVGWVKSKSVISLADGQEASGKAL